MSWVAVARSEDVQNGMAMPSGVADIDLAIWRSEAGAIHAWGDRCPHRGMRLSHGFVRGETLACIYHGWQYDAGGGCAAIPAHPDLVPPKSICAQTYPCAESTGLIWVALAQTDTAVPEAEGMKAVHSLEVACAATQVTDFVDHPKEAFIALPAPYDITFALQPRGQDACMLHVLAPLDHDPKVVSDRAEDFRAAIEGSLQ